MVAASSAIQNSKENVRTHDDERNIPPLYFNISFSATIGIYFVISIIRFPKLHQNCYMHSHSKNEDRRIAALIREQDRLQEELSAIQKELSLLYVSKQRESKAALSIANLYPLGQTVRIVN